MNPRSVLPITIRGLRAIEAFGAGVAERVWRPSRGRRRRVVRIGAVGLVFAGCHEVVAVPEPSFPKSTASIVWVARRAQNDWQFHAQEVGEPRPSFALGTPLELYGFGFSCPLERLLLSLKSISDPVLPPPSLGFVWTGGETWSPVSELPPPMVEAIPEDGREVCASFVPKPSARLSIGLEAPSFPGFGWPRVHAVREPDGRVIVLQPLIVSRTRREPMGARVLLFEPDSREARQLMFPEGFPMQALERRSESELVWAGAEGIAVGSFEHGFSIEFSAPQLSGAVLTNLAASPPEYPLEVFTIAHDRYPGQDADLTTVTLGVSRARGSRVLMREERRRWGDLDLPDVVWTAPGRGWAIGLGNKGEVARIDGDRVRLEKIQPRLAARPFGIAYEPGFGVVIVDTRDQIFHRPPNHPDGNPWIFLDGEAGEQGPLVVDEVSGVPVMAVYDPSGDQPDDGSPGVRFTFFGPGWACSTEPVAVEPFREGAWLTAGRFDATSWWFISGWDDRFQMDTVNLPATPGVCSRPPDEPLNR